MNLQKKILNPQALSSLYEGFPSLDDSEIMEVTMKRDEPRVLIKFMIDNKPARPPARWPENYDVVYLALSFIGVRKFSATGWQKKNVATQFLLKNIDDLVSVCISGKEDLSVSFDCDWISVESVVPGSIGSP
ncbi:MULTISPECIES: immunity 50 family protein [unclassified Variovorax]|jgi:hypothetical protein|uniref:immunity 50 family protein n=1 Tax=unclassified Variovorax TaxID=663243 RepID=UPI000B889C63|nr:MULTISPECIES: immunity 50 family protein [unclassified Variovorax]